MESINSIPGKLLYLSYRLYKQKLISMKDKGILKDLILNDNKQISKVYDRYVNDGTQLTITTDLISLLRAEKQKQTEDPSQSDGSKKRKMSVTIPKRNIQKLSHMENRI